jgi:hypothetical protein
VGRHPLNPSGPGLTPGPVPTMKVTKHFLILSLGVVGLTGCSSGGPELTVNEQKAFDGGKPGGPRSDEAKAGLADFRRQWEAKHGASGPPSQAKTPDQG